MKIDFIIVGLIAALSGLYALYSTFGVVGACAGLAVMVTYALLLKVKSKKPQEKTLSQNIRFKLPITIVIAGWKIQLPYLVANRICVFRFCGLLFLCAFGLEDTKTGKIKL